MRIIRREPTLERLRSADQGSAVVEAAIVLPCLVLLLHWSTALTELLLVRLKAAEAARRALWEATVGRAPAVVEESGAGLWMSRPRRFVASVEVRSEDASRISNSGAAGAAGFGFTTSVATARVHLDPVPFPNWLLPGGDLPSRKGADDFARPAALARVDAPARSSSPMRLVFDTWRAWPSAGADPAQTYRIVEREVSRRVSSIAFAGLRGRPGIGRLAGALDDAFSAPAARAALGGRAPSLFATTPFDEGGPITILPPAPSDTPFVPNACGARGACANSRAGDVLSTDRPARLAGADAFSDGEDSPRATIPFRIHARYWTRSGGSDGRRGAAVDPYPARLAEGNGYVTSWACRGHFFAGAVRAEEADVRRRYREPCR